MVVSKTTLSAPQLDSSLKNDGVKCKFFRNKFRFFILILGLFCLSAVFSNMITLNFTLICMDPVELVEKNSSKIISLSNDTRENPKLSPFPIYHYTQYEKTILQWTVSIASLLTTFPFSWLCSQYGARYLFFICGIFSVISTAFIPIAAKLGFTAFIFVRIFQGVAYACDFAVIGVLCTRWAALRENAKFLGILTCFSPLSSFLTNSFSGMSSLGWPWVHYFHAIISAFLFVAWFFFYTDNPAKNYFVTAEELEIIHHNKSESHKKHDSYVPYLEIMKDKVVWAVWLNAFADLFSGTFLLIYAPTYINNVLGYSATTTGFLGALTVVTHIPVKIACGYVSDTYHCLSENKKMRIFNTVALLSPAAVFIYLCFAPANTPMITIIMFALVHAGLGFNCGGFYKCGALVSRQFAEFVIACSQLIKCVVFFVAPALVAIFVHDDRSASQWHIIFYFISGMMIAVFFFINLIRKARLINKD